jgi:hypothetical protein
MDPNSSPTADVVAPPLNRRFRNAILFAVGMVTPASAAALWFGVVVRDHGWTTSDVVLTAIVTVIFEAFFILTALFPFLFASLLLRRGAPIARAPLLWSGGLAGCMPGLAPLIFDDMPKLQVAILWFGIAFVAAIVVLVIWGRRAGSLVAAPAPRPAGAPHASQAGQDGTA